MGTLQWKRVYEKPTDSDGFRILIDRLWPRGIKRKRPNSTVGPKKSHRPPNYGKVIITVKSIMMNLLPLTVGNWIKQCIYTFHRAH